MGTSSSLLSLTKPAPHQFTPEEIQLCDITWNHIIYAEPATTPPPYGDFKSFRLYFYSLCFQSLRAKLFDNQVQPNSPPIPPPSPSRGGPVVPLNYPITDVNALHTIVIFMFKLLSIYITTIKANKLFDKYAKSLSLSSTHLGIKSNDIVAFQDAFLIAIQQCYINDEKLYEIWKQLFQNILDIVLPECYKQELLTSMRRPLRLSGGSNLRDTSEADSVLFYAEYAFKLILTTGNEEEDPNSVNSRLSTSLYNSIENEYDPSSSSSLQQYKSQSSS